MQRLAGTLLIVASAISFGLMPTFASWVRRGGVQTETMLSLRFGLAAVGLAAIAIAWKLPLPRGRVLAALAAIGGIGYVGVSLCYFAALKSAPSGLVALLFYLYPVSVTALAWLFFRERLSTGRVVALVMAMLGVLFLLAPMTSARPLGATAVGVMLALASGVIYALYVLAGTRVVPWVGAVQATLVICAAASVVLGVIAAARRQPFPVDAMAWGGILALAAVSTVGGLTCFLAGLRLVGPVRASTLSALEPVVAVAAGRAFLGESVSAWSVAGGVLVVAAAVLTAREQRPA